MRIQMKWLRTSFLHFSAKLTEHMGLTQELQVRHTLTSGVDENRKVSKRVNGRENEPDTRFIWQQTLDMKHKANTMRLSLFLNDYKKSSSDKMTI